MGDERRRKKCPMESIRLSLRHEGAGFEVTQKAAVRLVEILLNLVRGYRRRWKRREVFDGHCQ